MDEEKCQHEIIHEITKHRGVFGSLREEVFIFCKKCGLTPQQIMADNPKHQHRFDIKGSYAGESGLTDYRWWHCRCGASKKLED